MSSFVITKAEYIKAAGTLSGIVDAKDVFLFDYRAGKKSGPQEIYDTFVKFYEMNTESVQEQYGDPERETDSRSYKQEFNFFLNYGKMSAIHPEKIKKVIMSLRQFFSSAEYQTEREDYNLEMREYFNRVLVALMPYLCYIPREDLMGCWGSFEAVV